ncbi:hypothetical protein EVAR_29627_1 [Eumeta japonica]|uniref:Uncharacterized protein n=1 Tax=Eumeta variegata TaxID=151549 RepID=A0A4C1WA57_EUMVA|nr:hypothetical protein EVAR_29627_1 [Eumeta japonica]
MQDRAFFGRGSILVVVSKILALKSRRHLAIMNRRREIDSLSLPFCLRAERTAKESSVRTMSPLWVSITANFIIRRLYGALSYITAHHDRFHRGTESSVRRPDKHFADYFFLIIDTRDPTPIRSRSSLRGISMSLRERCRERLSSGGRGAVVHGRRRGERDN